MALDRNEPDEGLRLGSVVGRYRLDALIGRGGMGVVFRATDVSLQRPVALKVLSPELATEPTFRARFERESLLAAAIEHPSIVPIYDAGAIGDTLYIAMRYVPGQDLRTILRNDAPLEFDRTIALMRQLADALDAAHRRGLVHRDVKPGNVLVEKEDEIERAILVDFGLTRRLGEVSASGDGLVGTVNYVAPEQIEGRPSDGRTDQYGLACVVVHCLTGAPPFSGESDASVLYAHLHARSPSISAIDGRIPPGVDAAIARAMAKSPDERYPDCRSLVAALAEGSGPRPPAASLPATPAAGTPDASSSATPRRRRHPLVAGVAVGVAAIVVVAALVAAPPAGGPVTPSPSVLMGSDEPGRVSVLGPVEGEAIYFAGEADGDYDLYVLDPGRSRPRRLTRTTRNERQPAVSPDGRTIAYVVGDDPRRDIWLMNADGSRQRPLVTHPADDADPAWSADGKSLAFASRRSDPQADIYEIRDDGDGLDQRDARNIADRPATEQHPDWAPTSRRIAIASNHYGGERDIILIDPDDDHSLVRLTSSDAYDQNPAWAPDRGTIAFDRRPYCATCVLGRGSADIHSIDLQGRRERQLTKTPGRDDVQPDWSPDGRALAFASGRPGAMGIFAMSADGERRRRLTDDAIDAIHPAWAVTPRPADASESTVSAAP